MKKHLAIFLTSLLFLIGSARAVDYQKFPDVISQEIQRKDPESFKLFNLLKGLFFPKAPGHVVAVPAEPSDGQIPVGDPDGGFLLKTLTAGTNITLTPSASTIQISATGGGGSYTDEQAQDAVGTILTDSASVDFTYNDAGNTITAAVLPGGVTLAGDVDGAANANDLDELAVEAELEAVLDLQDLQGAVTDAQVPNTITLDNLTQITTRDHGSLTGLSDDDHSIYALLAGRAAGQSLTGGTGGGDDLNLRSTSNATKGNIFFGTAATSTFDEANDRWGFFLAAPSYPLHISKTLTSERLSYFSRSQSTPQASDTNNTTVEVLNTISASSASNELAIRGLRSWVDNSLTGGGVVSFLRSFEAVFNASPAGATTNNAEGLSIYGLNTGGGTILNAYGVRINALSGTNLYGVGDDVGTIWYNNGSGAKLGIGTSAPAVGVEFVKTDSMLIPKGTTAQRPTGVDGYIRHNTDIGAPEFYENAWTQFVGVIDRQVTQNDVVNTLTETSFYSFSVPANVLDTQKMLRLTIYGDYLNNSGAGRTLTVRVKFGGTTYYNDVSGTLAASASRHPFRWEILVGNRNATNVQSIGGYLSMGVAGGATTGIGDMGTFATNTTGLETPFYNDGAIDTTVAQTLEVTVKHSTNHASLSIRRQMAILEIM